MFLQTDLADFVEKAPFCFALLRVIRNDQGESCDFIVEHVNPSFEEMIGISSRQIVGLPVQAAAEAAFSDPGHWLALLKRTVDNPETSRKPVEWYSHHLNKHFRIRSFMPDPACVAVYFSDNSQFMRDQQNLGKLVRCAEDFIGPDATPINYQQLADLMREIAGARIVTMNLYSPDLTTFSFKAISGDPDELQLMDSLLDGEMSSGKPLRFQPHSASLPTPFEIVEFQSFVELAGKSMPAGKCETVSAQLGLGKVYISRLSLKEKPVGNFTIYYSAGQSMPSPSLVQLLTRQVNLLLTRQEADDQIRHLNEEIRMIFNSTQDALFLVRIEDDGRFVYRNSNQAMRQLLGLSTIDPSGLTPYDLFDRPSAEREIGHYRRCLSERSSIAYEELLMVNGAERSWFVTLTPIQRDGRFCFVVGSARDTTEEKRRQRQIEYLSYHDQLTGLYNRHYFEDSLHRLDTARSLPISLLMADVNGLKLSNDVFGHAFGDTLLQRAAALISANCRAEDVVARVGGDEFEVILPRTSAASAEKIITRMQRAAAQVQIGPVQLSLSIGYATRETLDVSLRQIRRQAEDNMYHQKMIESPMLRSQIIQIIRRRIAENPTEERHALRCGAMCEAMSRALNMNEREQASMRTLGQLHDLGKIILPDAIINKPTELSRKEWDEVQRHAEASFRILSAVNEHAMIAEFALAHHERWDGTGYPRGLSGDETPQWARILAVVDAFESMTSERPWRPALKPEQALEELRKNAGSQFDPTLVDVFIKAIYPQLDRENG